MVEPSRYATSPHQPGGFAATKLLTPVRCEATFAGPPDGAIDACERTVCNLIRRRMQRVRRDGRISEPRPTVVSARQVFVSLAPDRGVLQRYPAAAKSALRLEANLDCFPHRTANHRASVGHLTKAPHEPAES